MESNKIQDFFVKLKESAKKHKKLLITSVSALVLGVGLGSLATVSDDVYEANNNDIETVQSQIEEENYVLDNTKSTHYELTAKKEELSYNSKSLDSKIVSLNREISTKEQSKKAEAERAAAEQAKAEADKVAAEEAKAAQEKAAAEEAKASTSKANTGTVKNDNKEKMVWRTKSGKKYHSRNDCGNTDSSKATQITLAEAERQGLTPCSKCY